jgi:tight adherence protein B
MSKGRRVNAVLTIALAAVLTALAVRMLNEARHRTRLARRLDLTAASWRAWFDKVSGRHLRRFDAAFPEALEAIARGLRSGASAVQSLQEASAAAPDPLAEELRAIVLSVQRGQPLAEAFEDWTTRQPHPSVRLVAAVFDLGIDVGGPMAMAIDGVAQTLRQRLAVDAELNSLSAQARLSAVVIAAAPLGFLVFSTASDRRTLSFLLGSPLGFGCLVTGLALDVVGGLWMRHLSRLDS